jgi:alkaline phosphatase
MVVAVPALLSTPPLRASAASGDPVIAAAGDIACVKTTPDISTNSCYEKATSDLILSHTEVSTVLTLGDNQYPCGAYAKFLKGYDPTWGRFRVAGGSSTVSTHPALGNHEYETGKTGCDAQASGYFQYFGGAAQPNGTNGYYYFDVSGTGTSTAHWRVIVLNANCLTVPCSTGSAQEQFLRSAISGAPSGSCIMAAWHQPRFKGDGVDSSTKSFWRDLYNANGALVLNGHAHYYQRYVPQDPSGNSDPMGLTEIISGTGGANLGSPKGVSANTAKWDDKDFGVVFVALHDGSFSWQFIATNGSVIDSGTQSCTPVP